MLSSAMLLSRLGGSDEMLMVMDWLLGSTPAAKAVLADRTSQMKANRYFGEVKNVQKGG